jgi:putative colanic acid biosynthesis acetyltransferase WcaF
MSRSNRACPTPTVSKSTFGLANKVGRYVWGWVWLLLFRPSPTFAYAWRRWLLRLFGAEMGPRTIVHRSARVWAPWNLQMEVDSCIGEFVDCYCGARVVLGRRAVVSQYSLLCAASHDYEAEGMPGIQSPIRIGDHAWVAADVYIGPGVTVGDGAVVGARASVYKDVPAWVVVGGNPARVLKTRVWRPRESRPPQK